MASRPPEHRPKQAGTHDPARARFYFISFHRILGAVLVMLGLLVTQGAIDWPEKVGWALLAVGLVDAFVAPVLLARLWRTPPQ